MTLTLADSGKGRADVTLNAVAEMALDLGFEKQGGAADAQKKASQRADLKRFFQTYGVNALTPFKEKFAKEKLLPPEEHVAAAKEASEKEAEKNTFAPVTKEAYAEAVEEYESLARKWKLFKKPGGVAVRSGLYYDITGAKSQVDSGDVTDECPQWNDVGAVDYAGKAAWEGHKRWTGKSADEARAAFCALFADAKEDRANNFF